MIASATSTAPDAAAGVYPRPHRWTRREYHAIADAGLFRNGRVELIGGTIVDVSPQGNKHAVAIGLAQRALHRALGDEYWIRVQMPLRGVVESEPEPDLAIVPGSPRDYHQHPATARLIVEVSDATLAFDRGHKASLYAAASVEDYWIVNLIDNTVELLRSPAPDPAAPFGHAYTERRTLRAGDSLAPLIQPDAAIPVADLLP